MKIGAKAGFARTSIYHIFLSQYNSVAKMTPAQLLNLKRKRFKTSKV